MPLINIIPEKKNTWLPCPFCGKDLLVFGHSMMHGKVTEVRIHPRSRNCPLGFGIVMDKKRWNRRVKQKKAT